MKKAFLTIGTVGMLVLAGCGEDKEVVSEDTTKVENTATEQASGEAEEQVVEESTTEESSQDMVAELSAKYGLEIGVAEGVDTTHPALVEAVDVIFDNIEAAESEDIEKYMSTLSSNLDGDRGNLQSLFDGLDLEYKILELNIKEISDSGTVVDVTQEARAEDNDESDNLTFQNHRINLTHTLIYENDKLVISASENHMDTFVEI